MLALQGGVAEHARMVEGLGARAVLVRTEGDLAGPDGPRVDALILPGGESSVLDRLLRRLELFEPLRDTVASGLPTLGTCAGLILLARALHDPAPGRRTLDALDVAVRRNAFGPQLASTEAEFPVEAAVAGIGSDGRVRGALIRAPEIADIGPSARAIVRVDGRVLGATSRETGEDPSRTDRDTPLGRITGISFHPELSGDPAFHRALIAQAESRSDRPEPLRGG